MLLQEKSSPPIPLAVAESCFRTAKGSGAAAAATGGYSTERLIIVVSLLEETDQFIF